MYVSYPYLDKTGLTNFWGKIKNKFVAKDGDKVLSDNNFSDELYTKLNGMDSVNFIGDSSKFLQGDGTWGTPSTSVDDIPHADYGTYGVVKYASDDDVTNYLSSGFHSKEEVLSQTNISGIRTNDSYNYGVSVNDARIVNGIVCIKCTVNAIRSVQFDRDEGRSIIYIPGEYSPSKYFEKDGKSTQLSLFNCGVDSSTYGDKGFYFYAEFETNYSLINLYRNSSSSGYLTMTKGSSVAMSDYICYPYNGSYTPPSITEGSQSIDGTEPIQIRQYSILKSQPAASKCRYQISKTQIGNAAEITSKGYGNFTRALKYESANNSGFYIECNHVLIFPISGTLTINFDYFKAINNSYGSHICIFINNELMDIITVANSTAHSQLSYEVLAGESLFILGMSAANYHYVNDETTIQNLTITLE